jgi:hypothetical protein
MKRDIVEIRSRDYWFKVIEMLQQNWALIDIDPSGSCLVYFVHDESGVFDEMHFTSQQEASNQLTHNGFRRYAKDFKAQEFIGAPKPPFYKDSHPNGPIYSSGRYWSYSTPHSRGAHYMFNIENEYHMSREITEQWMKEHIDYSNRQAARNRNHYPVQEQATQVDLWEYVPCECDKSCTCRKYGCTHHWILKKGLSFEEFRDGFLRMFVDKNQHQSVINALNIKGPDTLNSRVIKAFHVLQNIQTSWREIAVRAGTHNKTLFCDDWLPASFRDQWSFRVEGTSIYLAKQYCVLFPDICVPYDIASRSKMIEHFDFSGADYTEFLTSVREAFLKCMNGHTLTIPALRRLDNPQDPLPFNPSLISLPRPGVDYGTVYTPAERTISIVLDKCFYQPKTGTKNSSRNRVKPANQRNLPSLSYKIQPLSGIGQTIMVHGDPPVRWVLWGGLTFELSNGMIQTILDSFFAEYNRWYLLGANMTTPDPTGLGSFVERKFSKFSSRHASAIAAIMVHERFVLFRGRKPIELKKIAGREEMAGLIAEE